MFACFETVCVFTQILIKNFWLKLNKSGLYIYISVRKFAQDLNNLFARVVYFHNGPQPEM